MGTKWNVFTNNLDLVNSAGTGSVDGPAVSTDNAVARFDGTTGDLLQNSGTTLSDADLLSTGELNLTTDLAVAHGGTGASSLIDGAYLLGSGTGAITALDGTAKGAIPAGDGTTDPTILSVGLDAQVLTADSAEVTGLKWTTVAGTGDVTADANMTNNSLVRGNGGAKGVQDSGILIDDSDNLNIPTGGVLQVNAVETLSATALGTSVVGSSLTSVGTIGTGTWQGTAVADEYGGTGQTTWTKGDILYASGANTLAKLAVGADNEVLVVNVDVPNWEAQAGGGDVTKVGTPVDSQVGVWTGDGTIEGDAALTFDTSDNTLVIAASGKLAFGAVDILSDSSGTMTLSNIDAIDATTETTLESAIDTLSNLTTVGALDAGSITSNFGTIDTGSSAITTTGVITGGTVEATTDTAADDNAAMGYTSGEGLVLTGQGSVTDVTIKNDADATVISIPTGTTTVTFAGATDVSSGTVTGPSGTWDSGGVDIATTDTYAIAGTDVLNATTLGSAVVASSLTSVGTLTSGVWNGTAILDEYGGTGQTTWTKGDILYASDTNVLAKLAIGADNEVLVVATDVPNWEAQAGGGNVSNVSTPLDNQIAVWTGATNIEGDASFLWDGTGLKLEEVAADSASTANFGQIWVKSDTPNTLWFTDDADTSFQLGAGGGSAPDFVVQWAASALDVNYTPISPLEKITTTAIIQKVRSFAFDTIEYCDGKFEVPPDMNTTGTITFSIQWFARTVPSPSENVIWQIEHAAVATTEDLDSATFTAIVFAASATGTTQNALVRATKTETRANLGWVAGDTVFVKWSRKSTDSLDTFDSVGTTADDALLVNAAIIIPQA